MMNFVFQLNPLIIGMTIAFLFCFVVIIDQLIRLCPFGRSLKGWWLKYIPILGLIIYGVALLSEERFGMFLGLIVLCGSMVAGFFFRSMSP